MIAGLLNNHQEFFSTAENLHHQLTGGSVKTSSILNPVFSELLRVAIDNNADVKKGLNKLNILNHDDQVLKYYLCNYSEADDQPDIFENGTLGPREFVKCSQRGICPAECLLCKPPHGETKKELRVLEQIGAGKVDKEICDLLNISTHTLRAHKDHISAKAGLNRKPALAILSHKLNLA